MAIIKLTVELVKLVYKIIEGIVRALITSVLQVAVYTASALIAFTLTIFIIRYGVCDVNSCFNGQTASNFAVLAVCALALFATYVTVKRFG